MRLVHRVEPLPPDAGRPAWRVELRARVGPFARSKQLRMVRTVHEPPTSTSASSASRTTSATTPQWVLTATVDDAAGRRVARDRPQLQRDMWGSSVLQRVLDDEIRRGKDALLALVIAEPTR